YPDRVNKLVLYATDAGGKSVINPEQEVMDILSDSTSSDQQMIGLLFPDHWFENHPESKEYFKQVHEPFNRLTIKLQDEAVNQWLSDNGGASGSLYKLKVPTLIVSGDADQVVLFENSEVLFDSIANSTLVKMKNGGHGLMFQYPNELAGYIDAFLNDKNSF
ncbi:MAG: alpha/beta hydrolase, partial [Moheibacter sp.]